MLKEEGHFFDYEKDGARVYLIHPDQTTVEDFVAYRKADLAMGKRLVPQ